MRDRRLSIGLKTALLTAFSTILFVTNTYAGTDKVLYNFNGNSEAGADPQASLIFDGAGNLYGTTTGGGAYGGGTVFELMPTPSGGWIHKRLHDFRNDGIDGVHPNSVLVFDANGNLYGTTGYTADSTGVPNGTVFELTPTSAGGWTEKVVFNFDADSGSSYGGLIVDAVGNLYGTTASGGFFGYGTVFELARTTASGFAMKTLHSFDLADGWSPRAGLAFDATGNLYGTTLVGGSGEYCQTRPHNYCGTVFELTPEADGHWTEKVLHTFSYRTERVFWPQASIIFDAAGNLYGTTYVGGLYTDGTVFELSPTAGGDWTFKVLHSFGDGTDGEFLQVPLIMDAAGNLYGTTNYGGAYGEGNGTAFELTPEAGGGWAEKILHSFGGYSKDGYNPAASLILDSAGNLYGTAESGGVDGSGTVFEITP